MLRMYDWKSHDPLYSSDNAIMIEHEPRVTFSNSENVAVFVLTSTKMFFNRDAFPNDSFRRAAMRTFEVLDGALRSTLTDTNRSFNFRLKEWKEFPIRSFEVSHDGAINHNYDLDTWHWWFLQALGKLVREKYYT